MFIAPGLQRAEEASVRAHTGGELCTPVHHDTVATVAGSRNKASHISITPNLYSALLSTATAIC